MFVNTGLRMASRFDVIFVVGGIVGFATAPRSRTPIDVLLGFQNIIEQTCMLVG